MDNPNYERWKRVYDLYPLEELPWELGRPREVLVELLESGRVKKGKALDICCGAGTNTVYIASKGFEITGIDISPKAIEIAKEKARKAGVMIRFIAGNALDLPFDDEEFDFVFDMGCFHHILPEDREIFIKGVHRTLKTNGKYLLTCFSYKNGHAWNHFTEEDIVRYFSDDFRIEDIKHYASVEGDGVIRYFYSFLMEKIKRNQS